VVPEDMIFSENSGGGGIENRRGGALRVGDRGGWVRRADLRWERWWSFVRDPIAGLFVVGFFFVRAQAGVPVPLEPVVWV